MAKTTNVFARVEPEIKEQAESVLSELGIPMSSAISIYLRQIVLQRKIPFEIKLPRQKPAEISALSETELDAELEKGYAAVKSGRTKKASDVHARLIEKYDL